MLIPNPYEHYPPNWAEYDKRAGKCLPTVFGFVRLEGEINRFGARYRLARAFNGFVLEGYTEQTRRGYESLIRVFLSWSAFEQYTKNCGFDSKKTQDFLNNYGQDECVHEIRKIDPENRYFGFIRDRVHKQSLVNAIENYINGGVCSIADLAAAIRHIFVHGPLTPNANQTDPAAASGICDHISEFLLTAIGSDFGGRICRKQ